MQFTMEDEKIRSSTRIRKPTAKMKDLTAMTLKSVSKQKFDKVNSDFVNGGELINSMQKYRQGIDLVNQGDFECKSNIYYGTSNTKCVEKTNETEEDNFSTKTDNVNAKGDNHKNQRSAEFNQNDDLILETNTAASSGYKGKGITENKSTEDVPKTLKKQTVQVCVRLKDMILLPGSGGSETLEKRKQDYGSHEKDLNINNKSERSLNQNDFDRCDSIPADICKEVLEDIVSGKGSHKNRTIFKEDGSFVDTYELKAISKDLKSGERNVSSELTCEEIETFMKENVSDLDKFDEFSKDVDVQAEIELEHLDMSDEELSDLEEGITEKSLQCNICSKSFSKKYYLKKHMTLHSDIKSFQCEICGMSFATKAYLTLHSVVHSQIRKYRCEVCDKAFLRRANLNTHKRTHSDIKAFSCDTCNKKFKTKSGRNLHMKEHGSTQGFQCPQCEKSFSQHGYLQKHISIHAGIKPFKCTICEKSFPYNQSLQEHMRRHTGEKPETCDQCGKGFNNKRQLKTHMKYHKTVTQFSCTLCKMFYDSEQSLNKHITKTHNRRYDCSLCEQSFINKKHLRSHQTQEHKQMMAESRTLPAGNLAKAKKAMCSLCNSVFFNRYVLSKHLMSIHRLPEQDMKELLNIRKKGTSKNHADKKKCSSLNVKDVDNEKSFRVYYKDEEMAVYVKGTDDFETRLKAMTECNETNEGGNKVNKEVSYIVLEDDGKNINNFSEVTYSNDDGECFEHQTNELKDVGHVSDTNVIVTSNCVEQKGQVVSAESGDQNYYVLFTEVNDNSEKMVEEVQSEVIVKEELQNLTDDGTERIVLILNEGDDEENFMLENGEQLQILSNNLEYLPVDSDKEKNESEVMETGPDTVVEDFNSEKAFDTKEGCFIDNSSIGESIVVGPNGNVDNGNLPLLEQFQTGHLVSDTGKLRNIRGESDNIERKADIQNVTTSHITSENVTNDGISIIQYQRSAITKATELTEKKYIFLPTNDSIAAECSPSADIGKEPNLSDVETSNIEELLPKDNTAQAFTNFENALKLKAGDFESLDEYNKYIDKIIQTLQKAKRSDQQ